MIIYLKMHHCTPILQRDWAAHGTSSVGTGILSPLQETGKLFCDGHLFCNERRRPDQLNKTYHITRILANTRG